MDSPRGRIQLMEKTARRARSRLSPTVVEHFDRCLGCMACVSSCPSGVQYDRLIEETRDVVEDGAPRGRAASASSARLLFATLPYPRRMRWALRLAPLGRALPSPGWARPMLELAPRWRSTRAPRRGDARAWRRRAARVGLLTGCVQSVVLRRRQRRDRPRPRRRRLRGRRAAAGLLRRALAARGARGDESARVHRAAPRRGFDGVETVVVNASGCGSHLKDSRRARRVDVTEALAATSSSAASSRAARADGRLPGLLPPPPRAAAAGRLAAAARADPRAQRRRAGRAGPLLRHRPGSTTSPSRRRRASSATGRRRHVLATGARGLREREPRLPRPGRHRRCGGPGSRSRRCTRSSSLDASIRGLGAARAARRRPPLDALLGPHGVAAGRSSSSRSTRASAGKNRLQTTRDADRQRRRRSRPPAPRRRARPRRPTRRRRARSRR